MAPVSSIGMDGDIRGMHTAYKDLSAHIEYIDILKTCEDFLQAINYIIFLKSYVFCLCMVEVFSSY